MGSKSSLEKFVDKTYQQLDKGFETGLGIAVVTKDELLLSKGYGYKNRAKKKKVDASTLFALGSVTKPFTSLAVMRSIEKGAAALENPVRYYDADFELMDPHATADASFEDILSQRSGLPRNDGLWYISGFTLPEIYERLRYLAPDAQPTKGFREGFYYNNLVYSSAGVLLEKIEKTSWSKLVKNEILAPIGMTSSNTTLRGLTGSKNWAEPYFGDARMTPRSMKNIEPAGAVNSNVVDMAAWLQVFVRDGSLDSGGRLLSKGSMKQLRNRRVHDVEGFGSGTDYALGWFVSKADGHDVVWCPGNADGYSAYVSFMPSLGIGVVALVNQQVNTLGEKMATAIYEHALGISPLPDGQSPRSAGHRVPNLCLPPSASGPSVPIDVPLPKIGTYEHAAYGEIKIAKAGRKKLSISYGGKKYPLLVQAHGGFAFEMKAFGYPYQVPVIVQSDPVAGEALRVPFEPTSGWLDFLKT